MFISVSIIIVNSEPIQIFAQTVSIENDNKTGQEYVNNTLFISGTATEKAKSDLVTISIGVETTNRTATDVVV